MALVSDSSVHVTLSCGGEKLKELQWVFLAPNAVVWSIGTVMDAFQESEI